MKRAEIEARLCELQGLLYGKAAQCDSEAAACKQRGDRARFELNAIMAMSYHDAADYVSELLFHLSLPAGRRPTRLTLSPRDEAYWRAGKLPGFREEERVEVHGSVKGRAV